MQSVCSGGLIGKDCEATVDCPGLFGRIVIRETASFSIVRKGVGLPRNISAHYCQVVATVPLYGTVQCSCLHFDGQLPGRVPAYSWRFRRALVVLDDFVCEK